MSYSKKTTLGFPQWAANDKPEMNDFNGAFSALEEIIQKQNKKIAALEAQIQERQSVI